MVYEIYGIVNLINRKIYIGQTKQGYRKRFIQHLCPTDGSPLFRNAVKPKPIALCSRAIKSSSREEEVVLDLYRWKRFNTYSLRAVKQKCLPYGT